MVLTLMGKIVLSVLGKILTFIITAFGGLLWLLGFSVIFSYFLCGTGCFIGIFYCTLSCTIFFLRGPEQSKERIKEAIGYGVCGFSALAITAFLVCAITATTIHWGTHRPSEFLSISGNTGFGS